MMQRIPKIGRQMVRCFGMAVLALALGGTAAVAEDQVVITGPTGSSAFGTLVTNLPNGQIVVTDPSFSNNVAGARYGAVYLYTNLTLLSTITGCDTNDQIGSGGITVLANGNFLIHSPYWSTNRGAVTWVNATNGALADGSVGGVVAATNSLVGELAADPDNFQWGDLVGYRSSDYWSLILEKSVTALPNGNYVVLSSLWYDKAGAVTWCDGTKGVTGVVSTANSLVSDYENWSQEKIGDDGIVVLNSADGNYVVVSRSGLGNRGAATWCSGTNAFPIGVVSSDNSLVAEGSADGLNMAVTALANGHYVVARPYWQSSSSSFAGAVTWGDGTKGVTGVVSVDNSLVGSTMYDYIGCANADVAGIVALPNGHYLVPSYHWDNDGVTYAGAVTWGDGTKGVTGVVSLANSLVGSTANDQVGSSGSLYVLTNGNYVVASKNWDSGSAVDAGAATWGSGTQGVTGVISADNSLVGSAASDQVGLGGIRALANGNYVVVSHYWDNGAVDKAGAATWGDGTLGVTGVVSAANSLVGSTASDQVGLSGVCALTNGNYVVASKNWDNGAVVAAGAATWCNGTTGRFGVVSAANSLVGNTNDTVGGSVYALANGNYVVASTTWRSGTKANTGAATWGDGTCGVTGVVSAANSLVGSTASDSVGSIVRVLANGNYVVANKNWDNGSVTNAGAATWGDGTKGVTGVVSAANSLVGSRLSDNVGESVYALSNGNYVVASTLWDNGVVTNAGALTWGDGTQGVAGAVSVNNSLVGGTKDDFNACVLTAQPDGNYVVTCQKWDNTSVGFTDSGAVTPGPGQTGVKGLLSSWNSVLGAENGQGATFVVAYDAVNTRVLVGEPKANRVTLRSAQSVPLGVVDPPLVQNAAVTAVLTNGATCHGMLVTTGGAATAVGLLWGPRNGEQEPSAWAHTNWFNNGDVNPAWTANTLFSTNLTDLADGIASGQTYYYTWVARNAGGTYVAPSSKFFLTGEVTVNALDAEAQYPVNTATFRISRPGSCTNESITVPFVLSGSAINGTDYAAVASSVTLAAGATNADVVIRPFFDADPTSEDVVLTLAAGNGVYPYGVPANAATLVIANYDHTPVAIATVQAGNWTNPAIWSSGCLPGAGDDVTVTNAVVLDVSMPFTYNIVSNSASGTLTFQGTGTILRATTLLVGGTITHDAQSDVSSAGGWTPDHRIWLQCANLTVLEGGKIDAKGKGYAGGASETSGCGNGGGQWSFGEALGASYGAVGGATAYNQSSQSKPYGSVTNPAAPGSGGGGATTGAGGAGGGWVTIDATGIVNVAVGGLIDVNGDSGASINSAGGAGGSVCIHCDTFQGDGEVSATGGSGSQTGGNGSGGRIAVYVNTAAQQAYAYREEGASKMPSLAVARGVLPTGVNNTYLYAQGGSIHVSDPSSLAGDFSGGATFSWGSGNAWTPPYLTFNSGDYGFSATGVTVTVAGNVNIMGDARLTLTNYFTLNCANLLLTNSASLYLCAGVTNAAAPSYTARVIVHGNMDVHSNCVVVPSASLYATHEPPDGGVVRFEVGNLTIHRGGWIYADGEGYKVNGTLACGPGKGATGSGAGGGGGYGGRGGTFNVYTGGVTYGSAVAPIFPGSAGGNGGSAAGGAGGGCIWIRATGAVVNDGTISANGYGGVGAGNWPKGAGGSGGSLFIACRTIAGSGTMSANGGNGRCCTPEGLDSGSGGGGRIAIWYDLAQPADLDAFLARGSTAYITNAPAGYTLDKLSVAAGAGENGAPNLNAAGDPGTKSFYRANPLLRTVIILR